MILTFDDYQLILCFPLVSGKYVVAPLLSWWPAEEETNAVCSFPFPG
jgi:hypothetical protein